MYRVIKSKHPTAYAIHKIVKLEKGELYIEADPIIKVPEMYLLQEFLGDITKALSKDVLSKSEVIVLHKTLWNENDIPFFEDVADAVLEEEFSEEKPDDYQSVMDRIY